MRLNPTVLSSFSKFSRSISSYRPQMSPFKLRDYQIEAVSSVVTAVQNGVKRSAVVLATGGGKTVVMSHIIPKLRPSTTQRSKILILAHKEELVRQIAKTVRDVNPRLEVQIDMSKSKPDSSADVIVGSVPTLVRMSRLNWYNPAEFGAIFLDECHHATATSWTKILNHFGALEPESEIAVVGFTATMERSDGAALGKIFEKIVFQRDLLTMIKSKELCDVKFSTMKVDFSLKGVRTKFGDYHATDLGNAINKEEINLQVTKAYLQLREQLKFRSTLIFCVDVAHCVTLCGVFQANGVNAQYVTGETVSHERQAILEDFKNGKIDVLCNVLVFTEGTDIPNIDCLILARPTKSRPLLTQMIGRGLRLHHGKDFCHVVDMVGTMKVGVSSVPTLFGLPENHVIKNKRFEELANDKEEVDEYKRAQERDEKVNEILQLQKQMENLHLDFHQVDGFASLFRSSNESRFDVRKASQDFQKSIHNWVRLKYDEWGTPTRGNEGYFTIAREGEHDDEFTLNQIELVSFEQIKASGFKCPRRMVHLINTGKLPFLINIADQALGRRPIDWKGPISEAQQRLLMKLLKKNVESNYGVDKSGKVLHDALQQLSKTEAHFLIFAAEHSVNSLHVKWELKRILGLPPKLQSRYDKQLSAVTNQLEKLGATVSFDEKAGAESELKAVRKEIWPNMEPMKHQTLDI